MNKVQQALRWASIDFIDAEILLSHVLQCNRAWLYAHPDTLLTEQQQQQYQDLIQQREQGMPIAYLTGEREFWSLSLKVNTHTLIPRHETELLVELALILLPHEQSLRILDLGTGSGAIALALAHERPSWQIDACDRSAAALDTAKDNAAALDIHSVNFYQSDWFQALPQHSYHAIIANPPYIAPTDPHIQQGDLRFEPLEALVSEEHGLADLQHIITHSYARLVPHGLLLLEHGYDQKTSIQAILNKLGYDRVTTWQDPAGHDRVSGGYRP